MEWVGYIKLDASHSLQSCSRSEVLCSYVHLCLSHSYQKLGTVMSGLQHNRYGCLIWCMFTLQARQLFMSTELHLSRSYIVQSSKQEECGARGGGGRNSSMFHPQWSSSAKNLNLT